MESNLGGVAILYKVIIKSSSEKVTFEQSPEGSGGTSQTVMWDQDILDRGMANAKALG